MGPILFGIGLAGTLDEVVLHQILHWHHLYDRSTPGIALVSDGLLHIGSTAALLFGGRAALILRRSGVLSVRRILAGTMIGAGGFNFYDGTIQHKVFRLHQVRYGVDPFPYDAAFIGLAAAVLAAGLGLWFRPVKRTQPESLQTKGRA